MTALGNVWVICCMLFCLVTCHGESINDIIMTIPRKGLSITYEPIAISKVSSLIECAILCAKNSCCVAAIFKETNQSTKICSAYDIQLDNFITEKEHSTYLSHRIDKGKLFQFTLKGRGFNDYITLYFSL